MKVLCPAVGCRRGNRRAALMAIGDMGAPSLSPRKETSRLGRMILNTLNDVDRHAGDPYAECAIEVR